MVNVRGLSGGRGGARSPHDRLTSELTVTQCENVTAACWHSVDADAPLNRFISVNWSSADMQDCKSATSRFLKLAGDWLSDRGIRRAYIWVREGGGGDHVHILIHVPLALADAFSRRQQGWLKALGAKVRKGVILTEAIGRHYAAAEVSPAYYRQNLDNVIRYVLKGACLEAATFTDHRRQHTGLVSGQRAGVSRDLGRQARLLRRLGKEYRIPAP